MLRKGNEVKWTVEARDSFDQINKSLTKALVLINLDYSKEFLIFSFALYGTLVDILLHKNIEGLEHPISFFSRELRDVYMTNDMLIKVGCH
jgi:hypothetical protein